MTLAGSEPKSQQARVRRPNALDRAATGTCCYFFNVMNLYVSIYVSTFKGDLRNVVS